MNETSPIYDAARAEVENLRETLEALLAERPQCHGIVAPALCGACDWCKAEQVLSRCPAEFHHVPDHEGIYSCLEAYTRNPLPDCQLALRLALAEVQEVSDAEPTT